MFSEISRKNEFAASGESKNQLTKHILLHMLKIVILVAASLRTFSACKQRPFKLSKIDGPHDTAVFCTFFHEKKARLAKLQDPYTVSLLQRSGKIRLKYSRPSL